MRRRRSRRSLWDRLGWRCGNKPSPKPIASVYRRTTLRNHDGALQNPRCRNRRRHTQELTTTESQERRPPWRRVSCCGQPPPCHGTHYTSSHPTPAPSSSKFATERHTVLAHPRVHEWRGITYYQAAASRRASAAAAHQAGPRLKLTRLCVYVARLSVKTAQLTVELGAQGPHGPARAAPRGRRPRCRLVCTARQGGSCAPAWA